MSSDDSDPIESCGPTPIVIRSSLSETDPIQDPDEIDETQFRANFQSGRRGQHDKRRSTTGGAGYDQGRGGASASRSRKENDAQHPSKSFSRRGAAPLKGARPQLSLGSQTPLPRSPSKPSRSLHSRPTSPRATQSTASQLSSGSRRPHQASQRHQTLKFSMYSTKSNSSQSRQLGTADSSEEEEDEEEEEEEEEEERGGQEEEEEEETGINQDEDSQQRTSEWKSFNQLPTASAPFGRAPNGARILVEDTPLPTPAARSYQREPKILVPDTQESTAQPRSTRPGTQIESSWKGTGEGVDPTDPSSAYRFRKPGATRDLDEDAADADATGEEDGEDGNLDPHAYSKEEEDEDEDEEDEEMELPDSAQRQKPQHFNFLYGDEDESEDGAGGDQHPYDSSGNDQFELGDFGGGGDDEDEEQLPQLSLSPERQSSSKASSRRAKSFNPSAQGRLGFSSPSQLGTQSQEGSRRQSRGSSPAVSQSPLQTTAATHKSLPNVVKDLPKALRTNRLNTLTRRSVAGGPRLTNVKVNGEETKPEDRRKKRKVSIADGAVMEMNHKWGVKEGDEGHVRGGRTLRKRKSKD